MNTLPVIEIFTSIDGEVNRWGQGGFSTFIRLAGCNLRCSYCFGVVPGRKHPEVTLSHGNKKKLAEVKEGDVLLTFDESFNVVETIVTQKHNRQVDSWLRITIDGTQYFVTNEHPFMTPKGIIAACDLQIGDDIYEVQPSDIISFKKKGERNPMKDKSVSTRKVMNTVGHNGKKVTAIKEFIVEEIYPSVRPELLNVFNLTCSPYNTYFLDNMWIHNCDTKKSFSLENATIMTIGEIGNTVRALGCNKVTITGGEPLIHNNFSHLLRHLAGDQHLRLNVSVETNGTIWPTIMDRSYENVDWVFDYKLPSSGMASSRMEDRLYAMIDPECGRIKFVIKDLADYKEALRAAEWIHSNQSPFTISENKIPMAFSSCMGNPFAYQPNELAEMMINDRLFHISLNVQIHKLVNMS